MISDSLGTLFGLKKFERIISLVPSWTEFLCDIGLERKIVGRTDYCIEPETIKKVPSIGGTKNPSILKIKDLKPDIVIANKEENKQLDINRLRNFQISVFVTSAITVDEAIDEMIKIERMLTSNNKLGQKIQSKIEEIEPLDEFTFLYLVWFDPIIVASEFTYISHTLEFIGGKNKIDFTGARYPKVPLDDIEGLQVDYIFLPNEPYDFSKKEKEIFDEKGIGKLIFLDGKICSWYGKRLAEIKNLISNILLEN